MAAEADHIERLTIYGAGTTGVTITFDLTHETWEFDVIGGNVFKWEKQHLHTFREWLAVCTSAYLEQRRRQRRHHQE